MVSDWDDERDIAAAPALDGPALGPDVTSKSVESGGSTITENKE